MHSVSESMTEWKSNFAAENLEQVRVNTNKIGAISDEVAEFKAMLDANKSWQGKISIRVSQTESILKSHGKKLADAKEGFDRFFIQLDKVNIVEAKLGRLEELFEKIQKNQDNYQMHVAVVENYCEKYLPV